MELEKSTAQSELIAEQLRHAIDLLRAELDGVQSELEHTRALQDHRLEGLESASLDHEARLRAVQEGVTTSRVWAGLLSGGSGLVSLLALLRALLG